MERGGIFGIIGVLVIIVGIYFLINSNSSILPEDFTMQITYDGSSSGASRIYSANLVFSDGVLIEGSARGWTDDVLGKQKECIDEYDPVLNIWKNQIMRERASVNGSFTEWKEVTEPSSCYDFHKNLLTKEDILNAIENKELNPQPCVYGSFCYEIITQKSKDCSYYEEQLNLEYHDWNYFLERLNQGEIETIYLNSGNCEEYFWISLKNYPQPDKIWIKMANEEDLDNAIESCGNTCESIGIIQI